MLPARCRCLWPGRPPTVPLPLHGQPPPPATSCPHTGPASCLTCLLWFLPSAGEPAGTRPALPHPGSSRSVLPDHRQPHWVHSPEPLSADRPAPSPWAPCRHVRPGPRALLGHPTFHPSCLGDLPHPAGTHTRPAASLAAPFPKPHSATAWSPVPTCAQTSSTWVSHTGARPSAARKAIGCQRSSPLPCPVTASSQKSWPSRSSPSPEVAPMPCRGTPQSCLHQRS